MTNKEKYKQAFSVLHTSDISEGEVKYMAKLKKQQKMKLAAAAIAVCVIVGGTGTAYAANVGGIQRTIQLWMHGDQTSATFDLNTDDGSYSLEYKDTDGNERPLTEDEIMEELNAPDVEYLDDDSVWVYYKNQKIEITDKFDKDNVCYVKIENGDETIYMTVKYQNGYSTSPDKYPDPRSFN